MFYARYGTEVYEINGGLAGSIARCNNEEQADLIAGLLNEHENGGGKPEWKPTLYQTVWVDSADGEPEYGVVVRCKDEGVYDVVIPGSYLDIGTYELSRLRPY